MKLRWSFLDKPQLIYQFLPTCILAVLVFISTPHSTVLNYSHAFHRTNKEPKPQHIFKTQFFCNFCKQYPDTEIPLKIRDCHPSKLLLFKFTFFFHAAIRNVQWVHTKRHSFLWHSPDCLLMEAWCNSHHRCAMVKKFCKKSFLWGVILKCSYGQLSFKSKTWIWKSSKWFSACSFAVELVVFVRIIKSEGVSGAGRPYFYSKRNARSKNKAEMVCHVLLYAFYNWRAQHCFSKYRSVACRHAQYSSLLF